VTRRKYDNTTGYLTLEPGYAFVWNVDENKIEILGSIQDPLYSTPSIINGVVKVPKTTRYYRGHQNGDKVTGISLEIYDPKHQDA
jgi:hypothetical protein